MKKIFLTLVFMIVSLCSLAQPDYVGQAPADVHKYYPQYEEYFKTVFDKIKTLKPHSIVLLNEEIHENMELFEEDIKSEKDKRTIVLMALEMLIVGKKEFTKAKDVQGPKGDNDYKYEIAESIEDGATRKALRNRDEAVKNRDEAIKNRDRTIARSAKLEEVIALIYRLDEQGTIREEMDKILKGLEEFFAQHNDEEIYTELKQNGTLAKIIGLYDTYNKKIGRTPSALGQKFINEYNRIIKQ
jgi:hypothetical protein